MTTKTEMTADLLRNADKIEITIKDTQPKHTEELPLGFETELAVNMNISGQQAALIVSRYKSHAALVEALGSARNHLCDEYPRADDLYEILKQIEAALALAKGE